MDTTISWNERVYRVYICDRDCQQYKTPTVRWPREDGIITLPVLQVSAFTAYPYNEV